MANKKDNRYVKNANRAHYQAISNKLDTKGSIKNTAIETGKDLLVGVIGGGLLGSAIGKPSLLIGIGVTGAGHFLGNRLVSLLGVGMMAANGFQTQTSSVSGIDDNSLLGVKDRVIAFKNTFSQKLFIDKFLNKKSDTSTPTTTVSGLGLQYFNYADEIAGIEELNSVEDQIETSAMSRLQMNGYIGAAPEYDYPSITGPEELSETSGLSDVTDYNL